MSVPAPGAATARTVPPWRSATWRTMDNPRPEPGMPRADGAGSKRSKTRGRSAGAMPRAVIAHGELRPAGTPRPGRRASRTWPRCPAGCAPRPGDCRCCRSPSHGSSSAVKTVWAQSRRAPARLASTTWSSSTSPSGPGCDSSLASSVTLATSWPSSATWATTRRTARPGASARRRCRRARARRGGAARVARRRDARRAARSSCSRRRRFGRARACARRARVRPVQRDRRG